MMPPPTAAATAAARACSAALSGPFWMSDAQLLVMMCGFERDRRR